MQISTPNRYGPLQDGFAFELGDGYIVLVGENNSGKSAVLQLAFKTLCRHPEFGVENYVCCWQVGHTFNRPMKRRVTT